MYIFWLHPPFVCLHIISIFYRKKIWHIISIVYFDDFVMTLLRWNGICDMRRWSFHSLTWGRPPVFLPLWVSLDMYVSCSSWCVHDEVGFRYIHSVRQIGCQWYDLIEYLSVKYDSHKQDEHPVQKISTPYTTQMKWCQLIEFEFLRMSVCYSILL